MDFNTNETKYLQVYNYYKDLIVSGKLKEAAKMPSIRKCALQLSLSKTTIEMAYLNLAADGFIISKPQSGYFVAWRKTNSTHTSPVKKEISNIKFNFTSSNVDKESFDFNLWKRYIKSALRENSRMLSYGEPQGEYDLRETICEYVINKRNAVCSPEQIVIGAGFQSLLNILCPLLSNKTNVAFQNSKFEQGIVVFEDYGFKITNFQESADIIYMTPSHMTNLGDVMSVEERLNVVKTAAIENKIIIEDDYDNEFRYFSKPSPCLQGLAGGENVIYMSTFSKLLLPSIRLSFMILPVSLLPAYQKKMKYYNQTASKAEQLALCQFLRNGNLDSQIRKLKRLYTYKTKLLMQEFNTCFNDLVQVSMAESITILNVRIKSKFTNTAFADKAKEKGILIFPSSIEEQGYVNFSLSSCEVPVEAFHEAVVLLASI